MHIESLLKLQGEGRDLIGGGGGGGGGGGCPPVPPPKNESLVVHIRGRGCDDYDFLELTH